MALVTDSSVGLGFVIARTLMKAGYRVMITGRDGDRLNQAMLRLDPEGTARDSDGGRQRLTCTGCDVTSDSDVKQLIVECLETFGRLDVLINCVGSSDRGVLETLEIDQAELLFRQNVVTALLCSQHALSALEATGGVIVNIGSLASKVGAVVGGAMAKHALAGMTQQLRLELKPRGIHVCLVSPGRFAVKMEVSGIRSRWLAAAAGCSTRGRNTCQRPAPRKVAEAVLKAIQKRKPDVVLPRYLRLLITLGHAVPRLGDWLLLKFTSPKTDADT